MTDFFDSVPWCKLDLEASSTIVSSLCWAKNAFWYGSLNCSWLYLAASESLEVCYPPGVPHTIEFFFVGENLGFAMLSFGFKRLSFGY